MATAAVSADGRPGSPRGYTLTEVVVVLAIVGVLAAIAVPGYVAHIQRAVRVEAHASLLEAAQWLERQRTQFGRFDDPGQPGSQALPVALQCVPRNGTGAGHCRDYAIEIEAVSASAYRLRAVPVPAGRMARDACATMTLEHTGRAAHTGTAAAGACLRN